MKKIIIFSLLCAFSLVASEIKIVDKNSSDPIFMLPLKKYPKWLCEATLENGKKMQFVSVKSMMHVFQHQDYFKRHNLMDAPISTLYVQDYLTGRKVEATKASYVFGSRLVGPHGDDLIPFESMESAKLFMIKNGGTKILPYSRLSKGLIKYLDM